MAVVVEQTIPFSPASLDLHNPSRWNDLLPLVRPSVRAIRTAKGQTVLVDTGLAKSRYIHIIALGKAGNFSSKLLDDRAVTAIATEQGGAAATSIADVVDALRQAGAANDSGMVVIRAGKKSTVKRQGDDVLEVETGRELEQDHILHLLANATESCRTSLQQTEELLQLFLQGASTAHSRFHTEKAEGNPAILHVDGAAAFEKAKHAVERDLKHVMKAHGAQSGDVTYSVHYGDVNGLSRLENYIIAGEIAQYLESQNLPYRISHSSILDHTNNARGFSVSICAVPSRFLLPQAQTEPHHQTASSSTTSSQQNPSQPTNTSKMSFNDATVRQRIHQGCNAVIKAEPVITEYDTIVGDGDCGYTLRDGAKQVLSFIEGKDLTRLPSTLAALVHDLEVNMGGTSGALYCIYLTALAAALASEDSVPKALHAALQQMMKYTRARLGDRTMMDALIPFVDTLNAEGDAGKAVEEARKGVDGTKRMQASLGRSAYLDESATQGVPDPGAYGLLILLEGMAKGS